MASTTGPASLRDSPRLADFSRRILATGQPRAIGEEYPRPGLPQSALDGMAFLGAPLLLLLDRRGADRVLRHSAAPSLPKAFTSACAVIPVGVGSGVCPTAAHRGDQVIVRDLATDPLVAAWAPLAAEHGLRACWSTPIWSTSGATLGTVALYHDSTRLPNDRDQAVVDRSIHLARLAIEQADGARTLRRNVTRARSLAREQTALQRVATSVAGESDPAVLFGLVSEHVGRLLKADAGYVLRFEAGCDACNMGAWSPHQDQAALVDAAVTQLPGGICGAAARSPQGVPCERVPGHRPARLRGMCARATCWRASAATR